MFGIVQDWRYRFNARHLLRNIGTPESLQTLHAPDLFEAFCEGLPSKLPSEVAAAVGSGGTIIDAITKLFQWALANKEEIIKFVLEIISLFPKGTQAPLLLTALAGFSLPNFSGLLDLFKSGGPVMAEAVKLLEEADVELGEVISYIPVISQKIASGIGTAKDIVGEILAKIKG